MDGRGCLEVYRLRREETPQEIVFRARIKNKKQQFHTYFLPVVDFLIIDI